MPALVWLALSVLLTATIGSAYIPLGAFAVAKVALIVLFFMKLASSSAVIRFASLAGMFWPVFSFALTASDYLTRQ